MGFLRELPVLLLIAFALAFLLRTFAVQVFYIPSGSMEPTLQIDDRIIVEKLTYRFRQPRRGEVIVFEGEDGPVRQPTSTVGRVLRGVGQFLGVVPANARDLVKRVIGLPGDRVVIEDDGTVRVNGQAIEEPYVRHADPRSSGPFRVPPGRLFVLGDNRPSSSDSRFSLGFIDIDHVVGRAVAVIWPPDRLRRLGDGPDVPIPAPPPQPERTDAGEALVPAA